MEGLAKLAQPLPANPERPVAARRILPRRAVRTFAAAKQSDLYYDFQGVTTSPDEELRGSLRRMRHRSRQLAQDDGYLRRFLKLIETNVVGPQGIKMQSRAMLADGSPDQQDRATIESWWRDWGKIGSCDVTRSLSWPMACRQMVSAVARDGEVVVVEHFGFDNETGYAIQILEADYLDEDLWLDLRGGGRVRLGIEQDAYGAAVAYHLRSDHPGDAGYRSGGRSYVRVPADRVIHLRIPERPQQSRGIPWAHTAIMRLKMLNGYEESEVVASRAAATKMGFFSTPSGNEYTGDDTDEQGNVVIEAEPGGFEQLPDGATFHAFDPQHPVSAFNDFVRGVLRGIASGMNVAYHSLASDPSDANYGSQRGALLDERDQWKTLQGWFVDSVCERIYRNAARMAVLNGLLPTPPNKIEKVFDVSWQPRGWAWIDPLKDMQAAQLALGLTLTTRRKLAAAMGDDWEDLLIEAATEKQALQEHGLGTSGSGSRGGCR